MDFYKYICSGEQFRDRANRIPKWAREEHLEMNVPQKELWNYSEDEPKSSGPRMTGIYRLVVVFLFAGSTFLIADDHFFLGIVVFLAASWMLSIGDSNINDGEKETNKEPAVSAIRKRKRYRVAVNVGRTH